MNDTQPDNSTVPDYDIEIPQGELEIAPGRVEVFESTIEEDVAQAIAMEPSFETVFTKAVEDAENDPKNNVTSPALNSRLECYPVKHPDLYGATPRRID